jgi:hypothetical protein
MTLARLLKNGLFWELVCLFLLISITLSTILIPLHIATKATPSGTKYLYASGYLIDYYQYLSFIKQGMDKKIPLEIRYTWETSQPVIIHPFFTLVGYVAGFITTEPHVALMGTRVLTLIIFFIAFYLLIRRLFTQHSIRIASLLLLFAVTNIWTIQTDKGITSVAEAIIGQTTFSVFGKFALSPHHLLSLACILIVLAILHSSLITTKKLFSVFLLGIASAFLNPSIVSIILIAMAVSIPVIIVQKRKACLPSLVTIICFALPSALVLWYHQVVFQHIDPFTLWYSLAQQYNPYVTLSQYLYALGPMIILPPLVLLKKEYRDMPVVSILFAWAYVPIVLFQLRNGFIPMNAQRIFQSYQYIPLAILGTMGIDAFAGKLPAKFNIGTLAYWIIVAFFLLYALPPAHVMFTQLYTPPQTGFYNMYLSDSGVKALKYLDEHTPDESVVVAGEYVSNMIPGFTHNRVILGRDDAIANYAAHKDQVFAFIDGRIPTQSEWRYFAINHKVNYMLMGIDTNTFANSPISKYPYAKEVFKDGTVSVVKITP